MHIDVYSDLVCPWCRIGKQNLSRAIELWKAAGGGPVSIAYRAFQLDPQLPPEGRPFAESMAVKMGSEEGVRRATGQVTEAGAAVGVTFRYDRVTRMPNTKLAHRLIKLLPAAQQAAAVDALFRAYFEEGQDIARLDAIEAATAAIGPEAAAAIARLRTDDAAGEAEVDAELEQAARIGVTGVPFFVFNNRFALSGAYPAEELAGLMNKVGEAPAQ